MIKAQILDFNKEPEMVFSETFEMVRAIYSTYDYGNYTLEVNGKVVFNGCWRSSFISIKVLTLTSHLCILATWNEQ